MKTFRLLVVFCLLSVVCFNGCRSVNLGGTGQIGTVTGSGQVNIPVPILRADDQSQNDQAE